MAILKQVLVLMATESAPFANAYWLCTDSVKSEDIQRAPSVTDSSIVSTPSLLIAF